MSSEDIVVRLSVDEAVVLFEWLSRLGEGVPDEGLSPEQIALLRLQGKLESLLTQPFRPDYETLLRAARMRLVEKFGEGS